MRREPAAALAEARNLNRVSQRRAEIHFHALPGVDDGPRTMADAVELVELAVADGTSQIVLTPHVRDVLAMRILHELPDRVQELRDELELRGIDVELHVGGELDEGDIERLSDAELDLLAQGPAGERWLLYEPPFSPFGAGYIEGAERLRERGFGIVIAHPERSPFFRAPEGETALQLQRQAGDLVQITAGSILGRHGQDAWSFAKRWVSEGLVDLVSSDAHGRHKPPALSEAFEAISRFTGEDAARRLVDEAPRRLLSGADPEHLGTPRGTQSRSIPS